MSAPLVVNTVDGTVWLRRAATRGGLALYAPQDVCRCPEFVMATEAELAEHGIAGSADVLPVPVVPGPVDAGPVVRPLALHEAQIDALAASGNRVVNDAMHQRLCMCDAWPDKCVSTGHYYMGAWDVSGLEDALPAVLGLWESMRGGELDRLRARVAELEYVAPSPSCTRCYGADAVRFVAQGGATAPCPVCGPLEVERLQARVAELEAQRERRRVRLVALQNDALNMRGTLSPNGEDNKVPFALGETLTPAVEWLVNRVAELEAERHTTNEALSDAAEALRANRDRIAELERPAVERHRREVRESYRWLAAHAREDGDFEGEAVVVQQLAEREQLWRQEDKLAREFAADPLAVKPWEPGPSAEASADKLTLLIAPLRALREDEPEAPALMVYRASHDSIVMGLYTTAAAARQHCEAEERRSWAKFEGPTFDWIEDEEDGVAELTAWVGGEECTTGYEVTALEVASAYDEEADE